MKEIRVWDLPTRLFHWALATVVIVAILTGDDDAGLIYALHVLCGIAAFVLVLFRLPWGLVGNERARFGDFVYGWTRTRAYLGGLLRLRPPHYLGHNPLGGWAVLALLGLTLATAASGMAAGGLFGDGWAKRLEDIHEAFGSLLQILVIVHVAGVALDMLLTRDNLLKAMWHGRKAAALHAGASDARGGNIWLALAIALPLAVFGVYLAGQIDLSGPPGEHDGSGDHRH